MIKNNLVSVIIPVYNSEKYISACIESIINQTYTNLEIILINDGSSDNSISILNKYKRADKRITIINKDNEGVSKTRNLGIQISKGEYIMFVDNDDYLDRNFIENLVNKIGINDVIISGYKRVDLLNKILYEKKISKKNWSIYENMAPWGRLIKKKILLDKSIDFFSYPIGEDIIFNLKLYSSTDKIVKSNCTGYNWLYNNESVSNTVQQKFNYDIRILLNQMINISTSDDVLYFINRYCIWYLLFSGKNATSKDFLKEYKKIKIWQKEKGLLDLLKIKDIFKNESDLKNKLILVIFIFIDRMNLMKLFVLFYCKRRKLS